MVRNPAELEKSELSCQMLEQSIKATSKNKRNGDFGKKLGSHHFILIISKDLNKLKKQQFFLETNQVTR